MTCVEGAGRLSIHELIGCSSIASAQLDTILISVSACYFWIIPRVTFRGLLFLGHLSLKHFKLTLPRFRSPAPAPGFTPHSQIPCPHPAPAPGFTPHPLQEDTASVVVPGQLKSQPCSCLSVSQLPAERAVVFVVQS